MRYVPINCIREGMIVGKRLFGKKGELLLNIGTIIRHAYIEKLRNWDMAVYTSKMKCPWIYR